MCEVDRERRRWVSSDHTLSEPDDSGFGTAESHLQRIAAGLDWKGNLKILSKDEKKKKRFFFYYYTLKDSPVHWLSWFKKKTCVILQQGICKNSF